MKTIQEVAVHNNEEIRIVESKHKLHKLQMRFTKPLKLVGE